MTQDIKTQLAQELADVEWSSLVPHAQRDALIVVDRSLNLLDVATAIAKDDVRVVQDWIGENLIHKPSANELRDWNANPDRKLSTLIVQPFVLVSQIKS